eukprot:gene4322-6123_t
MTAVDNDTLSTPYEECERLVLQSFRESIIATDLNGNIIYWNEGSEKLFGWKKEEVIGMNSSTIISLEPLPNNNESNVAIKICDTFSQEFSKQNFCVRRDNSYFQMQFIERPVFRKGKLFGMVKTSIDTYAENMRHQLVTSATAHELRAPITGIIGLVNAMQEDNEVKTEDLNTLHVSCRILLNFVNHLIEIPAKPDSDNLTTCNISHQFKNAVHTMQSLGREDNISFRMRFSSDIPEEVELNLMKFQQLVFNVLSNALKYTSAESQINCSVYTTRPSQQIPEFIKNSEKKFIFVSIRDEGNGISDVEAQKLFIRYSKLPTIDVNMNSVHSTCQSSGLGLFNCRTLLRAIGGEIWLSWSEVGKGSEFTFAFPYNECECNYESDNACLSVTDDESERTSNSSDFISILPAFESSGSVSYASVSYGSSSSNNNIIPLPLKDMLATMPKDQWFSSHDYIITPKNNPSNSDRANTISKELIYTPRSQLSNTSLSPRDLTAEPLLRVLVCDDDHISQRIITRLLKNEGFNPIVASNGFDALSLVISANANNEPFHLVFTDLNMPIMDGYTCAMSIRERLNHSNIPIICAQSASHESEVIEKCQSSGISLFETKPLTTQKLRNVIQYTLEHCKASV